LSEQNPTDNQYSRFPADIPVLHGPITQEEQARIDEQQRKQARDAADRAFQERQVQAIEAANEISARNTTLTAIACIIAACSLGATLCQSRLNRKSWETANFTLGQMKTDAVESSNQFQVQLRHFDASLGQTQILAGQAVTQATQTTKLADDTHDLAVTSGKQAKATETIADRAVAQAKATNDLATQAHRSADYARNQVRPWVGGIGYITIGPTDDGFPKHMMYTMGLKNYGTTPAIHVTLGRDQTKVIVSSGDRNKDTIAIESAYENSCFLAFDSMIESLSVGSYPDPEDNKKRIPFTMPAQGISLFPNDIGTGSGHLYYADLIGADLQRPFYVVGCIAYSDHPDSNFGEAFSYMHTTFCYQSQTSLDSIKSSTRLTNVCGISETAK
jgi:hypothetical protein